MLESALETLNDVCLQWRMSWVDFCPPEPTLTPTTPPHGARQRTSRSPAPPAAGAPEPPVPRLPGVSGDLPSELAKQGRWFARTVGDSAVLVTFLPAIEQWREAVSAALALRKERRPATVSVPGAGGAGLPHARDDLDSLLGARLDSQKQCIGQQGQQHEPKKVGFDGRPEGDCMGDGTSAAVAAEAVPEAAVESESKQTAQLRPGDDGGVGGAPLRRSFNQWMDVAAKNAAAAAAAACGPRRARGGKGSTSLPRRKSEADLWPPANFMAKGLERLDDELSLGLHLFLVRAGDFGLPIELQSGMLREVRGLLLAHIPVRLRGALAVKSRQR